MQLRDIAAATQGVAPLYRTSTAGGRPSFGSGIDRIARQGLGSLSMGAMVRFIVPPER
jgi:hypothetical protein